jgi:hypothetical protein
MTCLIDYRTAIASAGDGWYCMRRAVRDVVQEGAYIQYVLYVLYIPVQVKPFSNAISIIRVKKEIERKRGI